MPTVYLKDGDGKVLLVGGKVAIAPECCCGCPNEPVDFTSLQVTLAISFTVTEANNNAPCEEFSGSIVLVQTFVRDTDFALTFEECADVMTPDTLSLSPTDISGQLDCGGGTAEAGFEARFWNIITGFRFVGSANISTECVRDCGEEEECPGYCNFDPGDISFPSVAWDGVPGTYFTSMSDSSAPNGWSYSASLTLVAT